MSVLFQEASANKAIFLFSIPGQLSSSVDDTKHAIKVTMPFGTNVKSLIPQLTPSQYASVRIIQFPNTIIESGQPCDFTKTISLLVTAQDGSTQNYTVSLNYDNRIFRYFLINGISGNIDNTGKTISLTLPYNYNSPLDVTKLIPYFEFLPPNTTVTVNNNIESSGGDSIDFTNPVVFRLTWQNKTTIDYTVTVDYGGIPVMKAFSLPGQISSTIDNINHTINVVMPSNIDLSNIVANFETNVTNPVVVDTYIRQESHAISMQQISGVSLNNFKNPVTYKLMNNKNYTVNYTVNVTKQ